MCFSSILALNVCIIGSIILAFIHILIAGNRTLQCNASHSFVSEQLRFGNWPAGSYDEAYPGIPLL
jgi:hypothetical protein